MTTSLITTVTLDTNVFPAQALVERAARAGIQVAVITVSRREVEGSSLEEEVADLEAIAEVGVLGESRFGEAMYGAEDDALRLERALRLLSNGSFPKKGQRNSLSSGEQRQLRDAMILCAHVAAGRDALVSRDRRGFFSEGRRQLIANEFRTAVMTVEEFERYLLDLERAAV